MGAAGSVQTSLPTGVEVTGNGAVSHGSHVSLNKELEAEYARARAAGDAHSVSGGSQPSSNRHGDKRRGGAGTAEDDDDEDRKSVSTTVTRLSQQPNGGGIHSALITRQPTSDALLAAVITLPRGGVYVRTQAGAVQFGIPPDTIKDSMALGLCVPSIFVVPQERFNLELGINVAEVEFPAYFNFFILQKDVRLLVTPEQERDIRIAFEETLEGPADEFLFEDEEYGKFADAAQYEARPSLRKEIDYFKEPRNGRVISCDTLLHFSLFDDNGKADLSDLKCSPAEDVAKRTTAETDQDAESDMGSGRDQVGSLPTYSLVVEDLVQHERYSVMENGKEIASIPYGMASFVPSPEILERHFKDTIILERDLDAQLDWEISDQEEKAISRPSAPSNRTTDSQSAGENNSGKARVKDSKSPQDGTSSRISSGSELLASKDCKSEREKERDRRASVIASSLSKLDDELYCLVNTGNFSPPDFGITMLGNSHGFDKSGTTTGFIIWIYGTGVAVDPPPHCDAYLIMNGVSPRLVTSVILTHCHADHDAGTFQKVLKERRVTLYTTKTVYQHFIRKYSAVSGLNADFLNRLLDFKQVNIAEPTFLHGAVFEFFYSLHALPCIGFKVTCGGKTMSYSADTFNDPDGLDMLEKRGIISEARKQSLLNFPWECDVVLHECGVPPIHTPASTLQKLPEAVKNNLYAVHIADGAAEEAGLRKAVAGFENTIVIHNNTRPNDLAIQTLLLCAQADIFRDADINQCIHLLQMSSRHRYRCGYEFNGTMGGVFFIISEGVLRVERDNKEPIILKLGDYFGEISAMNGGMEHMRLTAITNVEIIDINKFAFNQFLQSCPEAHQRLLTLESMRNQGFTAVIRKNSVFSHLSFPQKTQLQSLTSKPRKITAGESVLSVGEVAEAVYIVLNGEFSLSEAVLSGDTSARTFNQINGSEDEESKSPSAVEVRKNSRASYTKKASGRRRTTIRGDSLKLKRGAMYVPRHVFHCAVLGESDEQRATASQTRAFVAITDGALFEIEMSGFQDFLLRNPGIQLALMKHSGGVVL